MDIIQTWLLVLGTPIYVALDTLKCALEQHFWYTMLLVSVISSILTLVLQYSVIKCWKILVKKFKKNEEKDNHNVFELKQVDPESLRSRNRN